MPNYTPQFTLAISDYKPFWQCVGFESGINPCLRVSSQLYQYSRITDSVLPNCTGYAWGRFFQIYKQLWGVIPKETPLCEADAGSWYNNPNITKTYTRSNIPQLGAIACWSGGAQGYGHVSIVEEIGDGYIKCSESGWRNYVNNQWVWSATLTGSPTAGYYNNYYNRQTYTFQGFILNSAVTAVTSSIVTADNFIEAVSTYVGRSGADLQTRMGLTDAQIQSGWGAAYLQFASTDILSAPSCPIKLSRSASTTLKQNSSSKTGTLTYRRGTELMTAVPGDLIFIATTQTIDPYACDAVGVVTRSSGDELTCLFGDWGTAQDRKKTHVVYLNINKSAQFLYAVFHPKWEVSLNAVYADTSSVSANDGQLNIILPSKEDAILREFGYMNDQGEPSIITSDIRVSLINLVSPLSLVDSLTSQLRSASTKTDNFTYASSDANSVPTSVQTSTLTAFEKNVISYLRQKSSFSLAGCIGVLANAAQECGGVGQNVEADFPYRNYNIGYYLPDGPPGVYSRGMFMWNDAFNNQQYFPNSRLEDRCPDWRTNLSGQLDYLLYTLDMTDSRRLLRDRLCAAVNTEDSAAQCASDFCINYENPADVAKRADERSRIARLMWRALTLIQT